MLHIVLLFTPNQCYKLTFSGLFIEPAVDCAVRELKEETGIKLDTDEVKNSPWIDLLQTENFNPRKGDDESARVH